MVLAVGLIFLILAFPGGDKEKSQESQWLSGRNGTRTADDAGGGEPGNSFYRDSLTESGGQGESGSGGNDGEEASSVQAAAGTALTYEQQLEARLRELLSHVEGVGEVEVMIVLKSSEEKVWKTDRDTSYSTTKEIDSNGGSRDIRSQEVTEDTILTGQQSSGGGPLLEKELKPEIGGVVVSAAGGGSPQIQAEISAAVEALFDVPSHKIKVLKRAE